MVKTLIIIISFLLGIPSLVLAQDITATPAPSKTPTDVPQAESGDDETEPAQLAQQLTPWTQADLSILTGNVQRPNGVVWHNNKLYAACTGDSTIYELDDRSAATHTYIFGVRNAHTLYAESDATGELSLWVPDFQTNRLLQVGRTGVVTISENLSGPWGIAYINESDFLVTNLQANNVVIINRTGEMRDVITGLRSPTGVVADETYIYIANNGSARRAIEWVSRSQAIEGSEAVEAQPLVSGLQNTTGMVLAEDGYLYFTYALGTRGVVGRINPASCRENGGCSNDQVEIVIYSELAAPLAGLSISPDMRLFVHAMFSPDIYWVQLDRPDQA